MIEAAELDHRLELAKARMQLFLYRQTLYEHGIEPPDRSGEDLLEMWAACRDVIRAAQLCVANMGTSMELLQDWREPK